MIGAIYSPRLPEISIAFGTLCLFMLLYLLASRFIPMVPVWEVREGQEAHMIRKVGKTVVPSVSDLD